MYILLNIYLIVLDIWINVIFIGIFYDIFVIKNYYGIILY